MDSLNFNAVPSVISSFSISSLRIRRCSLKAFNLILVSVSSCLELKKLFGVKLSILIRYPSQIIPTSSLLSVVASLAKRLTTL